MKSINGIYWKIANIPERLILKRKQSLKISYLLSKIFLEKKYTDEEIYYSIFKSQNNNVIYENNDFSIAYNFIINCIKCQKKILIFGDYDVDGYSSTYLLYDFFSNLKIDCDYYIPDRSVDGYGPNLSLLKKLTKINNYGLVIFVDCGSNSIDELTYLDNKGLKTIVIDHHQIYEKKISKNLVIINPLKNLFSNKYSDFCATTLVYFFINYLSNIFKIKNKIDFNRYLFFSAIATICDQMPLRGYNKFIVKDGLTKFDLSKLNNFKKVIKLKNRITSADVGYTLGPILNSASRLGYSSLPFNLLIEKKNSNIDKIVSKLINLNEKRKKIQSNTIKILKNNSDYIKNDIIFKYKENINEGLLGVIASNFVEIHNRPSFILTNSSNIIKCSSRSIPGYDIGKIFYLAIKKKIIISGGGHSMAGGCVLKKKNLFKFKKFLNNSYIHSLKINNNIKYYISDQSFESLLTFLKGDFQYLEPLGSNNTNPYFRIRNVKIRKLKVINNLHLQLIVNNKFNKSCVCFAFNVIDTKLGNLLSNAKKELDLIVQINNKIIQKNSDFNLIIKDAILQ